MPNNRSNKPRLQPRGKGNSNPDNWARGWEIGVFYDCAKRGVSCEGATIYVTHYPCIICARILFERVSAAEEHYLNAAVRTTTHRMRDNSEITDAFASQGIVF